MGQQLSGILLIACIAFSISISKRRGATVSHMILAMVLAFLIFLGAVEIFPALNESRAGAAAAETALAAGALTALIHARRTWN